MGPRATLMLGWGRIDIKAGKCKFGVCWWLRTIRR
mgnify:CR=1 FL=1